MKMSPLAGKPAVPWILIDSQAGGRLLQRPSRPVYTGATRGVSVERIVQRGAAVSGGSDNLDRKSGLADGIVITPSQNPPKFGGSVLCSKITAACRRLRYDGNDICRHCVGRARHCRNALRNSDVTVPFVLATCLFLLPRRNLACPPRM
jgi:hypothetical protein